MNQIQQALTGKKSYLLAAGVAVYAGLGWALGYQSSDQAVNLLIASGAISTLRAGIAKVGQKN